MEALKLIVFTSAFLIGAPALAHTYKCKDKNGEWKEEACPDYEKRRIDKGRKLIEQHELQTWKPRIGMKSDEVAKILRGPECRETSAFAWCGDWKVNSTESSRGRREQWVFTDVRGMPLRYLYFDNGVLVTIQE